MHERERRMLVADASSGWTSGSSEGAQRRSDALAEFLGGERFDGCLGEDLTDHRTPLQDGSIEVSKSVEAGGQERLDRWRYREGTGARRELPAIGTRNQRAVFLPLRDHLLEEEGIPLGR